MRCKVLLPDHLTKNKLPGVKANLKLPRHCAGYFKMTLFLNLPSVGNSWDSSWHLKLTTYYYSIMVTCLNYHTFLCIAAALRIAFITRHRFLKKKLKEGSYSIKIRTTCKSSLTYCTNVCFETQVCLRPLVWLQGLCVK